MSAVIADLGRAMDLLPLLLWWLACLPYGHSITNYCELSCSHRMHTVCRRMWNCGPVPGCLPILSDWKFRSNIQKAHNRLRNRAAGGDTIFKALPMAANMNALIYDVELEYIAMCWANTCPETVDDCGVTRAYQNVTQIVYASKTPINTKTEIFRMVYQWYKEKIYLNESMVRHYRPNNRTTHIAQMLWAKTRYFGCFRVRNASGMYLIYCNYATGGLVPGQAIYKVGLPLSICFLIYAPCASYKNLCGYLFEGNSADVDRGPISLPSLVLVLYLGYIFMPRLRATRGRAKLVVE